MGKISKRGQDPHQTDADRAGINKILSKKCQHFAVGTYVVLNDQRWKVDRYLSRMVWLTRETGDGIETIYVFNPYFIQGLRND